MWGEENVPENHGPCLLNSWSFAQEPPRHGVLSIDTKRGSFEELLFQPRHPQMVIFSTRHAVYFLALKLQGEAGNRPTWRRDVPIAVDCRMPLRYSRVRHVRPHSAATIKDNPTPSHYDETWLHGFLAPQHSHCAIKSGREEREVYDLVKSSCFGHLLAAPSCHILTMSLSLYSFDSIIVAQDLVASFAAASLLAICGLSHKQRIGVKKSFQIIGGWRNVTTMNFGEDFWEGA